MSSMNAGTKAHHPYVYGERPMAQGLALVEDGRTLNSYWQGAASEIQP